MNKTELIAAIVADAGVSKKDVEAVVNSYANIIAKTLSRGDKVSLVGFGTFEPRNRAARTGRNPQTGKDIKIPASVVPAFKPGKTFKDAVKKAKAK